MSAEHSSFERQESFDRLVERAVELLREEIVELARLLVETAARGDEESEKWDWAEHCSPSCMTCVLAVARDDVDERWSWDRSRAAGAARAAALRSAADQLHADSVQTHAAVAPWGSSAVNR